MGWIKPYSEQALLGIWPWGGSPHIILNWRRVGVDIILNGPHAINSCIWPHLRLYFWHTMSFKRREETRREKFILKDNLAVVLAVYSVDYQWG